MNLSELFANPKAVYRHSWVLSQLDVSPTETSMSRTISRRHLDHVPIGAVPYVFGCPFVLGPAINRQLGCLAQYTIILGMYAGVSEPSVKISIWSIRELDLVGCKSKYIFLHRQAYYTTPSPKLEMFSSHPL